MPPATAVVKRPTAIFAVVAGAIAVALPNHAAIAGISALHLQIAMVGLSAIALVGSVTLRNAWIHQFLGFPDPVRWTLVLVPAAGLVSALVAGGPIPMRVAEVAGLTSIIGIALATPFALTRVGKAAAPAMVGTYALAAAIFVFTSLVDGGVGTAGSRRPRLLDWGDASGDVSDWITWILPVAAALPAMLPARRLRYLPYLVLSSLWALGFFAGAFMALISMVVATTAVAATIGRSGRRWARLQAISAVLGFAVYRSRQAADGLAGGAMPSIDTLTSGWSDALRTTFHHGLLGAGPGHYALASGVSIPDSVPLRLVAEWGVPAALAVTVTVAFGLHRWYRFARTGFGPRTGAAALCVAALTGGALASAGLGVFVDILRSPVGQVYAALTVGWMLQLYRPAPQVIVHRSLLAHIAVSLTAMLVLLALINVAR